MNGLPTFENKEPAALSKDDKREPGQELLTFGALARLLLARWKIMLAGALLGLAFGFALVKLYPERPIVSRVTSIEIGRTSSGQVIAAADLVALLTENIIPSVIDAVGGAKNPEKFLPIRAFAVSQAVVAVRTSVPEPESRAYEEIHERIARGIDEDLTARTAPYLDDLHGAIQKLEGYLARVEKIPEATLRDGSNAACNESISIIARLLREPSPGSLIAQLVALRREQSVVRPTKMSHGAVISRSGGSPYSKMTLGLFAGLVCGVVIALIAEGTKRAR